jgi:hypothetical protein
MAISKITQLGCWLLLVSIIELASNNLDWRLRIGRVIQDDFPALLVFADQNSVWYFPGKHLLMLGCWWAASRALGLLPISRQLSVQNFIFFGSSPTSAFYFLYRSSHHHSFEAWRHWLAILDNAALQAEKEKFREAVVNLMLLKYLLVAASAWI